MPRHRPAATCRDRARCRPAADRRRPDRPVRPVLRRSPSAADRRHRLPAGTWRASHRALPREADLRRGRVPQRAGPRARRWPADPSRAVRPAVPARPVRRRSTPRRRSATDRDHRPRHHHPLRSSGPDRRNRHVHSEAAPQRRRVPGPRPRLLRAQPRRVLRRRRCRRRRRRQRLLLDTRPDRHRAQRHARAPTPSLPGTRRHARSRTGLRSNRARRRRGHPSYRRSHHRRRRSIN